ncbi:hypothetical protein OE749_14635 [Aestuariibacter sp. AA17]|uniref:Uncharacterized protein n=1 Tax=Fluctibacter corallii TaxID=2984329 RepID=A0ABT3AB79_9ALTE|nr:hypothetical protein [Aestuariibacter sp. AA17]MCV2885926.1 hypothetical protein [Aestuariibacter sp. AA17]
MTVLIILAVLFVTLILVVPMLERSKSKFSQEDVAKMSRWIWPLVMILLVTQLIMLMID